jgi:hypothetical protein
MAMLKRNVALPDMVPANRTRDTSRANEIANMQEGESGIMDCALSVLKPIVKRVVANHADAGKIRHYIVWASTSDGSADETGLRFSAVARLSDADAEVYNARTPGCVISGRASF